MNNARSTLATVSGFAALGFAVLALLYWAFVATPPLSTAGFDWPLRILVIVAIVSFSVYIFAAPESVGQAAARRSNRLTLNAVVASVVALAIAVAINVIFETIPSARADLTAGQTFTLSDQTINVLKNLKDPVNAVVIYRPQQAGQSRQEIEDLLKEYTAHSTKLRYEFVDYDLAPGRAGEYGVTRLPAVVFDRGGARREIATGIAEADFTGALVRLQQTGKKTVAFLTGHGERDPEGADEAGFSQVQTALQKDNYGTVTWNLAVSPTLTVSDVTVLIVAEPKRPLAARDLDLIGKYLDAGGHALIMLDPVMPAEAFTPLANLLKKYGVTPVQGGVVDQLKNFSQMGIGAVLVNTYPETEITRPLSQNRLTTIFPLSLGFQPPTSTVNGLAATSIIQSSPGEQASWLETDLNSTTAQYNAGKDLPGPVTMALSIGPDAASQTVTQTNQLKTKLVVFGDSDFASNFWISQDPSNLDLVGNSVAWLAGANELVSIRAKENTAPRTLLLDAGQQRVLWFSTVLGLPVLVLLLGASIWWRRR